MSIRRIRDGLEAAPQAFLTSYQDRRLDVRVQGVYHLSECPRIPVKAALVYHIILRALSQGFSRSGLARLRIPAFAAFIRYSHSDFRAFIRSLSTQLHPVQALLLLRR